jgi:hypothetical protein
MKLFRFICILLTFMFILFACNKSKTLTEQRIHEMIDEGFSKSNNVLLHKEKVENGIVVFYGDNDVKNAFGVRFIKKTLFDWEATYDRGGGGFGSAMENIDSIYLPKYTKKSPFPLLFGIITDTNIAEIKVEYNYKGDIKEIQAKTIKDSDRYIWFAFVNEPLEHTIYTIKGYSKSRNLVETVEEVSIP